MSEARDRAPRAAIRPFLRPRLGTILALGLAGLSVILAWTDPFYEPDEGVLMVSNRSGGRRVFPTLVDADPSKATIELQAPNEPLVRIVPSAGGSHELLLGDEVLGPVADEDFEGLWSSLRLATARRTAGKGQGVGQRGVIRVSLPDQNLTLALGDPVIGGGVYGALEVDGDTWVVETEMLTLVQQSPLSWLSKRLLPIDVGLVTRLAWGDELIVGRGDDGFWRVREGATPAVLATDAVEFRVRRLLRAQLDPLVERETVESESLRPWLVITTLDESSRALHVGGACPKHEDRRLVDRGLGLLGCVPAGLLERWPLLDPEAGMLEPHLFPHDYGRVVGVDLVQPSSRRLMRRGGEWFYSGERVPGVEALAEEEVRRWYQGLARVEVALVEDDRDRPGRESPEGSAPEGGEDPSGGGDDFEANWALVVHADTGDELRVRCALAGDEAICRRDEGPRLRVLGELPANLVFDVETFAPRRLTEIGPGEIRELEILPVADSDASTVRQSVHSDLGAWQLDAPAHVDDSGAIDEVRLESVLWALRNLRAEAWVEDSPQPPLRRLNAEVVPEQGERRSVSVVLFPDCVVKVDGQRAALVSPAQCAALAEDLFFDDPLRFLLERSRGVEISRSTDDMKVFVRRRDDQFVTSDGKPLADEAVEDQLREWIDWRSAGLRSGEPPAPVEWTLDVRRDIGPQAQVEIGPGWVRLRGAPWYYVERSSDEDGELEDDGATTGELSP